MVTTNPSFLRATIKALPDNKLAELITSLKFNTKLEQSALHYATNEQRRRNRQAKEAAVANK